MVLAPGCGRRLHTTAGQLGRPAVVGAISRRGSLWRHHRASTATMTGLGVFNFDRVFARLAFFRRPATRARTAIGADLYLTNKKRIPRQHGSYLGCRQRQKMLRIVVVLGNPLRRFLASFICHRRGLLTYMAAWLAWNTSLKQSVRRRMHSHAVCAVYSRSVACMKGYHSRPLLQSAAHLTIHRGDHTLANRLATAVGSEVDKCCVRFWVAYEFRSA